MSIGLYSAIYFVIWWIVLFAVLPWGVRSQHEEGEIAPGTDPGAPVAPFLLRKAIATTLISAAIFAAGVVAWKTGLLALDRLPVPFDFRRH
jgi:predicted secreted protein